MKPNLTEDQRKKFEVSFQNIMREAPKELQDKYDNQIHWHPITEIPLIQNGIVNKLPPRLASKYATLFNKVKDRSI